jgi:hypothetical protein
MKARLNSLKAGLASCQEMKTLALAGLHFQEKGTTEGPRAGHAPTSGHRSMIVQLPSLPGDMFFPFRVKGSKLRAESRGLRCSEI